MNSDFQGAQAQRDAFNRMMEYSAMNPDLQRAQSEIDAFDQMMASVLVGPTQEDKDEYEGTIFMENRYPYLLAKRRAEFDALIIVPTIPPFPKIASARKTLVRGEKLVPGSYAAPELSQLIMENAQPILHSPLVQHPGNKFSVQERLFFDTTHMTTSMTDDEVWQFLHEGFHLFNRVFFFSSLHEEIELRICRIKEEDWRGYYGPHDRTININLEESCFEEGHQTQRQQCLETLAHEMLHAFLTIYSCTCEFCQDTTKYHLGKSGHGPCWMDAMTAIRIAVLRDLNWLAGFGLGRSLQLEIDQGFYTTREEIAFRWQMRCADIPPPAPQENV